MNTNDTTVTNGASAPAVETQANVSVPAPKKGLGKGRTKGAVSHSLVCLADLNAILNPSAMLPVSRIWAQNLQIVNKPVTSKGEMTTPASSLKARVEHTSNGKGSGQISVEITETPEAPQATPTDAAVEGGTVSDAIGADAGDAGTSPINLNGEREAVAV